MKRVILLLCACMIMYGCGGDQDTSPAEQPEGNTGGAVVEYTAPEPIPVPERKTPSSDTDWEAKVHNKNAEVIEILNILNPVAAYIKAGIEQYGERIKDRIVFDDWEDTQAQLKMALDLYESCKKRMEAGAYDKKLFLDLENTWQLLVKTGVAGVRPKTMLDAQLKTL